MENHLSNTISKNTGSSFNIREQVLKYVRYWYWFLIGVTISGTLAYLYLRYTIPQYSVSATILINQADKAPEISAIKDLGVLDGDQGQIENEIQILKSRTLMTNVIKRLKLNVQYFTEGRVLDLETYPASLVKVNFLSADSIVDNSYKNLTLLVTSSTTFSFIDKDKNVLAEHSFGKTIPTEIGDIVITPNVDNIYDYINQIAKIRITPINILAERYRNGVSIVKINKNSTTLRLSFRDPVTKKAENLLNTLIEEYNLIASDNKQEVSRRTSDFINDRLDRITGDLSEVDEAATDLKANSGLTTDVEAQAQRFADSDSRNLQEISAIKTQLSLIQSMIQFIQNQQGQYNTIPANLGFADPSITALATQYNTLIFRRNKLLKSSSLQNPIVVNLDEEINGLKQVLIGNLNSLKSSTNIKLSSLNVQDQYFSGRLYNATKKTKDLKVIERKQTIKEQLYLYLLQKREEAEIASSVTQDSATVIDAATTMGSYQISPKKKVIYMGALSLGLIIPFLFIYIADLLNFRVNTKDDLEKVLTMPLIGDVPKSKSKKDKIVISKTSRSSVAESFRILRANLDFLMAGVNKEKGKVIFVTSTVGSEGKTFVSTNLTKALSISDKKVIYIGTDLRNPKAHEYFDLKNGKETKGLTNFILDKSLEPRDVIQRSNDKEHSFDIIPSGIIPPNPSELLMQDRVKEIFEYLQEHYEYIIVDTAPVSLVVDTMIISKLADLTIYIVRAHHSDKKMLAIPQTLYQEKRLENMAVLLNATDHKKGYGYGQYGYGDLK